MLNISLVFSFPIWDFGAGYFGNIIKWDFGFDYGDVSVFDPTRDFKDPATIANPQCLHRRRYRQTDRTPPP